MPVFQNGFPFNKIFLPQGRQVGRQRFMYFDYFVAWKFSLHKTEYKIQVFYLRASRMVLNHSERTLLTAAGFIPVGIIVGMSVGFGRL